MRKTTLLLEAGALALVAGSIYGYFFWRSLPVEEARRILDLLGVKNGTLAEIGAGHGEMAEAILKTAPGLRLFATEMDAGKLKTLRSLDRPTLTVVEAAEQSTNLPAACCEAIYMMSVYHHIAEPAPWLASVKSSLKPGGRFLVIDFPPTWWLAWSVPKGAPPNRKGHGITADEVEKELRAAGFVIEKRMEPWDGRRFAILARRE